MLPPVELGLEIAVNLFQWTILVLFLVYGPVIINRPVSFSLDDGFILTARTYNFVVSLLVTACYGYELVILLL